MIFITHRMDEIEEIGDRITVMRSGETVAELSRAGWTSQRSGPPHDRLGRAGEDGASEEASAASRRGAPVLAVRGLKLRPEGRPIDLEVCAGELIGVAGLEGHGENEFLEALWGENTSRARSSVICPGARTSLFVRWSRPPTATWPTCRVNGASTPCSAG